MAVLCAQFELLCHEKGWPAGERQGHCFRPAAEAEVHPLPPGPDVLVGISFFQLGL